MKLAREMVTGTILVNLSGRGDKDLDYVIENWGTGEDVAEDFAKVAKQTDSAAI
jgi:tryptophan synthase beta chain